MSNNWQYSNKNPFVKAMMAQGNSTDMIGPHGPRLAGVRVPIGDPQQDKTSLRNDRGMWNVAGQGYYDVPTDNLKGKLLDNKRHFTRGRQNLERLGEEALNYNSDDAGEEGLGMFEKMNLWDTRSKLDSVPLGFKKGKVGANKDAYGVTASVGGSGGKLVKYIDTAIFGGELTDDALATLVHEYQHAADTYGGDMQYDKDYKPEKHKDYWDRGYEAFARLAGNSAFRGKDMTSAKGAYAVHPLVDFDPGTGTFNLENAHTYIKAKYKDGKMTKAEGNKAMKILQAEQKRLTDRMQNDAAFESKLYAYHPQERRQKNKKDLIRDKKQKQRVKENRGWYTDIENTNLWE